ncbi:type II toxin-antitoxin system RelE family toxin [Achromobacter xylosoxidans]|uniref:type II toxin-antitoxin system RelE family toxin n=1 Tax=Alcaligenes xylosoxydans xylosoxydans TaxID=85698 RepID=UPI0034629A01
MRTLKLTKSACKFFENLPAKQFRQVMQKVLSLLDDPLPNDTKKLQGAKDGERRVDIGEYRIVYRYDDDIVYIDVIDKRNDGQAYK